jgi:hypothetical protein
LQETAYGWWPVTGVGAVLGALAHAFKAMKQVVIGALAYE